MGMGLKDGVLKRYVSAPSRRAASLTSAFVRGFAQIIGVLFICLCESRRRSAEQTGAAPTATPL